MIERIPMGPADILAYEFSEELSEDDVKRLHSDLRKAIDEYGSVKLYTDVQKLESVTPRAVLEDMKLTPEYVSDVERYAVVGDERWQEWITKLGDLVTSGQARYFQPGERSKARRWLRREYTFEEEARRAMTQRYSTGRGENRKQKRGGFLRGLVRAVWAGAAGTWAMDRVTQWIMGRQDTMTVLREKMARVEGLDPSHALANQAARRLGISWRLGQPHPAGVGIHYKRGGADHRRIRHSATTGGVCRPIPGSPIRIGGVFGRRRRAEASYRRRVVAWSLSVADPSSRAGRIFGLRNYCRYGTART